MTINDNAIDFQIEERSNALKRDAEKVVLDAFSGGIVMPFGTGFITLSDGNEYSYSVVDNKVTWD